MKADKTNNQRHGLIKGPIELLTLRPGLPVRHFRQRVILNIRGKCFEALLRAEVREVRNPPARIIEMPMRPAQRTQPPK